MAELSNNLKFKLERLFDMSGGYVLDFTNATFADFVSTCLGFNPYDRYQGSKATVLRSIWQHESDSDVKKLLLELLDREATVKLIKGTLTDGDQRLHDSVLEEVLALSTDDTPTSREDVEFLSRDFGSVDLARARVSIDFQDVIAQRLDEIERCLAAEAPLAVIFLAGSTLEGLLYEVALQQPDAFATCSSAPTKDSKVKPLSQWTLHDFIITARELHIVGEDVVKHAHGVKDFRNYIHPRQQIKDNFQPRMLTAQMANQVLRAALHDLRTITT